jgi:hypothetical protein
VDGELQQRWDCARLKSLRARLKTSEMIWLRRARGVSAQIEPLSVVTAAKERVKKSESVR